MKTSITQIWMVCHLLPFAKVGQNSFRSIFKNDFVHSMQYFQVILKVLYVFAFRLLSHFLSQIPEYKSDTILYKLWNVANKILFVNQLEAIVYKITSFSTTRIQFFTYNCRKNLLSCNTAWCYLEMIPRVLFWMGVALVARAVPALC